ncbi:MAG: DUF2207 domain-containing protein [Acidimicrobiales bacterium]
MTAPAAPRTRARTRTAAAALLGALAGLLALLGAGPAGAGAAQAGGEMITGYAVALRLDPAGVLHVTETIDYEFGALTDRHGIRRFLPLRAAYDADHWRVYDPTGIRVAVSRPDGGPAPPGADQVEVNDDANHNRVIRVGSPTLTVSGRLRYVIGYDVAHTVEQVVDPFGSTFQELVWNAIGGQWEVPISGAAVTLEAPAPVASVRCWRGAYRSTAACQTVEAGAGPSFRADRLAPGEGMTVAAALPAGAVADATPLLEPRWSLRRAFAVTPATAAASAAVGALGFGAVFALLGRRARDRRAVTAAYAPAGAGSGAERVGLFEKAESPVRFRPPDGAAPGLVGVVIDERADTVDVSATLVDLAVRGWLRIEEAGEAPHGENGDWRLTLLPAPPGGALSAYEDKLLSELAHHCEPTGEDRLASVRVSELRRNFAGPMGEVKERLYEETVRLGWFPRRPDRVRGVWYALGGAAVVAAIAALVLLAAFTTWALVGAPALAAALALLVSAKHMPSRTAAGRRALEESVGYRQFLEVADADQLRFHEEQRQFVDGLGYAMVFGLTHRWAAVLRRLADQGVDVRPVWYVPVGGLWGPDPFGRLGDSMSSFEKVAGAALTAPDVSSSTGGGFGGSSFGGGFSGGGGGGGGGGSW